jgi:lysozyme
MTRDDIMAWQRLLRALGRDVAVDGIVGPETRAANSEALRAAATGTPPAPPDRNDAILAQELERDEGRRLYAYQDIFGWWTIGVGRLIDRRKGGGISNEEADYLKQNDIAKFKRLLDAKIPWWRELDPVRQRAVQNMAFQLGTRDMGGATFALIRDGKFAAAAKRLRGWKWAKQTPARADRVIAMIEFGRV